MVLADGPDSKSPRVCLSQVAAAARRTAGQWRGGQLGRVRCRRTWKVGRREGGAVRHCRAAGWWSASWSVSGGGGGGLGSGGRIPGGMRSVWRLFGYLDGIRPRPRGWGRKGTHGAGRGGLGLERGASERSRVSRARQAASCVARRLPGPATPFRDVECPARPYKSVTRWRKAASRTTMQPRTCRRKPEAVPPAQSREREVVELGCYSLIPFFLLARHDLYAREVSGAIVQQ
jgi:hypothetical protein